MRDKIAIFIFRRDFRVVDNPAFHRCVHWCESNDAKLVPCFIYSGRQVDKSRNKYFSPFAFSALQHFVDYIDSELDRKVLRLYTENSDVHVLDMLDKHVGIDAVFFNSDVTPFARDRDEEIEAWCYKKNIICGSGDLGDGYLVWSAGSILTKSGKTVPKVFSAFFRYVSDMRVTCLGKPSLSRVSGIHVKVPASIKVGSRVPKHVELCLPPKPDISKFLDYGKTRDDYNIETTRLSVYLKFGVFSSRKILSEVRKFGIRDLERQLIWREFYYHLAAGYPDIITVPNHHIRPDRDKVVWKPVDEAKLEMWRSGRTGDVLVDNAMRKLGKEGWIHNRLRMVVSTYLIKVMGIDWREGERVMATMLMDYDPAQNSGGWQSMDSQIPGQEISSKTQLRKFGDIAFISGK